MNKPDLAPFRDGTITLYRESELRISYGLLWPGHRIEDDWWYPSWGCGPDGDCNVNRARVLLAGEWWVVAYTDRWFREPEWWASTETDIEGEVAHVIETLRVYDIPRDWVSMRPSGDDPLSVARARVAAAMWVTALDEQNVASADMMLPVPERTLWCGHRSEDEGDLWLETYVGARALVSSADAEGGYNARIVATDGNWDDDSGHPQMLGHDPEAVLWTVDASTANRMHAWVVSRMQAGRTGEEIIREASTALSNGIDVLDYHADRFPEVDIRGDEEVVFG